MKLLFNELLRCLELLHETAILPYALQYEGMLAHSSDRIYVVTKFMLPIIGDLKFSKLGF